MARCGLIVGRTVALCSRVRQREVQHLVRGGPTVFRSSGCQRVQRNGRASFLCRDFRGNLLVRPFAAAGRHAREKDYKAVNSVEIA